MDRHLSIMSSPYYMGYVGEGSKHAPDSGPKPSYPNMSKEDRLRSFDLKKKGIKKISDTKINDPTINALGLNTGIDAIKLLGGAQSLPMQAVNTSSNVLSQTRYNPLYGRNTIPMSKSKGSFKQLSGDLYNAGRAAYSAKDIPLSINTDQAIKAAKDRMQGTFGNKLKGRDN